MEGHPLTVQWLGPSHEGLTGHRWDLPQPLPFLANQGLTGSLPEASYGVLLPLHLVLTAAKTHGTNSDAAQEDPALLTGTVHPNAHPGLAPQATRPRWGCRGRP